MAEALTSCKHVPHAQVVAKLVDIMGIFTALAKEPIVEVEQYGETTAQVRSERR